MPIEPNVVVSVIVPLRDDADVVPAFLEELYPVLREQFALFEVLLVDDGSRDGTDARVRSWLESRERLRYLRLSRSFGREVAISAGLEAAIGDFVVVMLPRTDPPALVPEFVRRCREGDGLVVGVSETPKRASWLARTGARLFHLYCRRHLGFDFEQNTTEFRALSRSVVNSVTRIRDRHRYLRVFTASAGYRQEIVRYRPLERGGPRPPEGLAADLTHAIEIVVANSKHPLRVVSRLGLLLSGLNGLYIGYVFAVVLFKGRVAEGWTTTSLLVSSMFFFLFLILAVLCEYIGRILEESQDRPLYFVTDEKSSPVSLEETITKNIVNESLG